MASAGNRSWRYSLLIGAIGIVIAGIVAESLMSHGQPNPTDPHATATVAVLDIGILVFREGLEAILVLATLTANLKGSTRTLQRPIATGVGVAVLGTLATWRLAVRIVDDLSANVSALQIQAATGLLAIVVLLIVMNWFFHKMYWTGWISAHAKRKQILLQRTSTTPSPARLWWGLGILGFTSVYREGFEVILFLQSYRLKLGDAPIRQGALLGLIFTSAVAVLTFVAHRHLPYRRMLIFTGVLLGVVLIVMVGEQAQEMQLVHWLPTTDLPWLARRLPPWISLWFACFPTLETLLAQALAVFLVLGSYVMVRLREGAAERASA